MPEPETLHEPAGLLASWRRAAPPVDVDALVASLMIASSYEAHDLVAGGNDQIADPNDQTEAANKPEAAASASSGEVRSGSQPAGVPEAVRPPQRPAVEQTGERYGSGVNLYVGNLPFTTTSDELAALFGRVGVVRSAQVITDRETGRSRGFGFVEMNRDDADAALEILEKASIDGRTISIHEARARSRNRRD